MPFFLLKSQQLVYLIKAVSDKQGVWILEKAHVFLESWLLPRLLSSIAKSMFVSSTINTFIFYLELCLETPNKEQKLGEYSFCKTSFQVRMDLKVQKRGTR